MGASSELATCSGVLGASAFLPLCRGAAEIRHNLLYDFSQVPIRPDRRRPGQIAAPTVVDARLTRFILFTPAARSSLHDLFHHAYVSAVDRSHRRCSDGVVRQSLLRRRSSPCHPHEPHPFLPGVVPACRSWSPTAGQLADFWLPVLPWVRHSASRTCAPLLAPARTDLLAYVALTQGVEDWLHHRRWI